MTESCKSCKFWHILKEYTDKGARGRFGDCHAAFGIVLSTPESFYCPSYEKRQETPHEPVQ